MAILYTPSKLVWSKHLKILIQFTLCVINEENAPLKCLRCGGAVWILEIHLQLFDRSRPYRIFELIIADKVTTFWFFIAIEMVYVSNAFAWVTSKFHRRIDMKFYDGSAAQFSTSAYSFSHLNRSYAAVQVEIVDWKEWVASSQGHPLRRHWFPFCL